MKNFYYDTHTFPPFRRRNSYKSLIGILLRYPKEYYVGYGRDVTQIFLKLGACKIVARNQSERHREMKKCI